MKKNFKALLCASVAVSAMTLCTASAIDLNVGSGLREDITNTSVEYVPYDTVKNEGTINIVEDAGLSAETKLINTGTITNEGSILAQEIEMASGSITGNGTFETKNGGSNAGNISQAIVNNLGGTLSNSGTINAAQSFTNSGTFRNNAGSFTTASLVNEAGASISNSSTFNATNIKNQGTFNNLGGQLDAALLANYQGAEFNNDATLIATAIQNAGTLNNKAGKSITADTIETFAGSVTNNRGDITVSDTLTNGGTFNNLGGKLDTNVLANKQGAEFNNDATLIATAIQNAGTLNNKAGKSITADTIETFAGSVTNNRGDITVSDTLTNGGTFNNLGGKLDTNVLANAQGAEFTNDATVEAKTLQNAGTFTNNSGKSVTADSIVTYVGSTTTNNGDMTANVEVINQGTFNNNGGQLDTALLANYQGAEFNNDATLIATAIQNAGTLNNKAGKSITADTIETFAGSVTNNRGDITVSDTLTNGGTFNNLGGTLETDLLANAQGAEFTNDATVEATTIQNAGTFTNNSGKSVTADSIVTYVGSTTTNNGDMKANVEVINQGTFNNNGGQLDTALLANYQGAEFNNDATLIATAIQNAGTLNNKAGKSITADTIETFAGSVTNNRGDITVNDTLTNGGTFNNLGGKLDTALLANKQGAEFVNEAIVNATTIQNAGLFQNNENKTVTVTDIITYAGSETNNDGILEVLGDVTNSGTFTNGGDLTVNGSFTNNTVFRTIKGVTTTLNSIDNIGLATIEDGSALIIENGDLAGTVAAIKGNNSLEVSNGDIIGTLNVGNSTDTTILNLVSGNVLEDAVLNITSKGTLVVNKENLEVHLNDGDTYNGGIILSDGIVEFNDFKASVGAVSSAEGGTTPYYEQSGGTLNLLGSSVLSMADASKISGGDINIDDNAALISRANGFTAGNVTTSGLIGAMNSAIENYTMDKLIIGNSITGDNQANLTIDVYGRCSRDGLHGTDKFIANSIEAADGISNAVINISDWTLGGDIFGWDAPLDPHIKLNNLFEGAISNNVTLTATSKEVFTPIGWYRLNNHGGITGNYTLDLERFNPQVYRGQVTTVAQWQNQLAIDDILFTHSMILPSFKEEDGGMAYSGVMTNRYASIDPVFAPYQYSRKDGGLWVKMYGNFENLQMNRAGLGRVGNNSYGALIGADFGLKELKNGWKFMPTAYIGYNGAHQTYYGLGAYQNGGQAGFLGTWYKDNFILGALAYGGIYDNSMDVSGRNDSTFNYFGGAAAKAAYNWRLHKDWVLQPNLFVAYNYFGQQNWHTTYGQMGMTSNMLNGVNIAPGVNLIWEKETFSVYGTLQYMYNVNGAVGGRAGHTGLPQVEMERGYIQYGLGFTKKFTNRVSGYLEAVLRNAGRTGCGFQMGFNIAIGKL